MDRITKEINTADVMECAREGKGWGEVLIVTNYNRDRNFINRYRVKIFAAKNNEIVVNWKKKITTKNLPESMKHKVYKSYPELIGIFVKSAHVIMTSNLSENVSKQIVNGTKGIIEGLYYIDKRKMRNKKGK